jgi:hypothetical protein
MPPQMADYATPGKPFPRSGPIAAVLWITLIAGTLDITENIIFNYFRSITPYMIFQYIASGLIGMRSFDLGWESVALGVAVHYTIAFVWTVVYFAAGRKVRILIQRPVIAGIIYGALSTQS